MSRRIGYPLAVHLLLTDGNHMLFLRRANTGYEDGRLSIPAGHVDPGESARAALAREIEEELGLRIDEDAPQFAVVQHKRDPADGEERVDLFFTLPIGDLEPRNAEPHKCSELVWGDFDTISSEVVGYVQNAIRSIEEGNQYAQYAW